jgi:hypothetical protein
MTVTSVRKDPDALTMTITVELDASIERAWAAVGRPSPARALVGSAHPSRHRSSTTASHPAAAPPTT